MRCIYKYTETSHVIPLQLCIYIIQNHSRGGNTRIDRRISWQEMKWSVHDDWRSDAFVSFLSLSHSGPNKMAAILQTIFSKCILSTLTFWTLIQILPLFEVCCWGSNWLSISFGTVYALVIKQWWFISPTDTGIARLASVKWSLLTVSHYSDVITGTMASQITSLTIVYSTVQSGTHQRKRQSSASLAFVWGIHRSPHKRPVMRKMFPFDDVIIKCGKLNVRWFDAMSLV